MDSSNETNNASASGLTQKSENEEVSLQSESPVSSQDSSNPNQATGWKLVIIVLCFVMAIFCVAIDNTGKNGISPVVKFNH